MPSPVKSSPSSSTPAWMIIIAVVIYIASIFLAAYLIQIIWNYVIIKKFPHSDIQELSFFEAFAILIFFNLLTSSSAQVRLCR
jgi:hypothetical protein